MSLLNSIDQMRTLYEIETVLTDFRTAPFCNELKLGDYIFLISEDGRGTIRIDREGNAVFVSFISNKITTLKKEDIDYDAISDILKPICGPKKD
ncbi:MAG: hypothetical protein ACE5PM_00285 [Candidatus Hydrothermarchaeales archaeon]